jgi:hypothetical protein
MALINIASRLFLAYNFAKGRNALFRSEFSLAKTYFEVALKKSSGTDSGLWAEAKLFLAICEFELGNLPGASYWCEAGLDDMRQVAIYSADDIQYITIYMRTLMGFSTPEEKSIVDVDHVRKSLVRDFPMELR